MCHFCVSTNPGFSVSFSAFPLGAETSLASRFRGNNIIGRCSAKLDRSFIRLKCYDWQYSRPKTVWQLWAAAGGSFKDQTAVGLAKKARLWYEKPLGKVRGLPIGRSHY